MQKDSPPTVKITGLTHDGRGIAKLNGKTIFIDGALPNEEVTFTYTQQRGKYDEGKVKTILTPAAERVIPPCPHFTRCGGCALQHLAYDAQIKLKQQLLLDQLKKFGGITPITLLPPLSAHQWGYRKKARLSVKYEAKNQAVVIGYQEKNSNNIVDIKSCDILDPQAAKLILPLKELINTLASKQFIQHIEIAVDDSSIALVFGHTKTLPLADQNKLRQFAQENRIRIYLQLKNNPAYLLLNEISLVPATHYENTAHTNAPSNSQLNFIPHVKSNQCNTEIQSTSDVRQLHIATDSLMTYSLSEYNDLSQEQSHGVSNQLTLHLDFQPTDFTQINYEVNQLMIKRALELLQLEKSDRVLDLFCGIGNFTLPMATRAGEVIGLEGNSELIQRAKNNAIKNHITNAQFYQADLNTNFATASYLQKDFTKILLDPPRTGALDTIQQIMQFNAAKIVYVSCNPATLARDSKILIQHGYVLSHAGIMDMFPHTHHVEAIGLFEK